jgi:hypothetical protein
MKHILMVSLLIAVMAFAVIATVHAQWGGGYELTWSTIDGGGGTSGGGGYTLVGTIGQPDVGETLNGGYALLGGFWIGGASQYDVYLPLVIK